MLSLVLPSANRPHRLLSFWLVMSALTGVLLFAVSTLWLSGWRAAVCLLATPILFLPVWFRPELASVAYRGWNKVARTFGSYARAFVMRILYYVVLFVVGRGGSDIVFDRALDRDSYWIPRAEMITEVQDGRENFTMENLSTGGSLASFLSWTAKSGNGWAWFLIPFLLLLAALDPEGEEIVPTSIYTLF